MTVPILPGLGALAGDYDGFILDVWGVIHDGATPYPHAVETLARLKRAGKATILLSNAPRRAEAVIASMVAMGIGRDLYGAVMSSGEAVHRELAERRDPWFARLGRRCHHIGPERDRNIFDGLDVDLVSVDVADFVLNTGPDLFEESVGDYEPVLRAAARRQLPMICANPDQVVIREGRRIMCAGALATRYQTLGGEVAWRGKPDPAIYGDCLEVLGLPRNRVLAVGDALHTDIAGAQAAGIDALFVTGGIHAEELGLRAHGEMPSGERVEALLHAHKLRARAAMPEFRW